VAAREQGKDLLVDFTGSDWCPPCMRLHDEVLSQKVFMNAASEHFVLVALDFPKREKAMAKVPNPERNQQVAQRFKITGYPTVLLMTVDGEVFGRTGYQKGGPAAYVTHIGELRAPAVKVRARVERLVADYSAARGEARDEVLGRIIAELEGFPDAPYRAALVGPLRKAAARGESAIRKRAVRALTTAGKVDADVLAAAVELDPLNAEGLYLGTLLSLLEGVGDEEQVAGAAHAIDAFFQAGITVPDDDALGLYVNAAWWFDNFLDDSQRAKRYAKLGLALAKEEEYKDFFRGILDD
ncbi:MAG: thioredoxin family protein, partial [Planctomycetota bacterium]